MATTPKDRFLGCLLGQAVGDALGAPFEGLSGETIYRDFGAAIDLVRSPPVDELVYTDDTQMMIGVAECLLDSQRIDPARLAQIFGGNYDPARCYGPGAQRIFDAMRAGDDWQSIVDTIFPGGSLGNGAAMRAAPIGLVFHQDASLLSGQARLSAEVTHRHPIGIDGAIVFANAISLAVCADQLNVSAFYSALRNIASTEEFQWQMKTAAGLMPDDLFNFGCSLEAHRSVTTALCCFTSNVRSFEAAVSRAISFGNDTDTLAGMAGALSGAYLGVQSIPAHLLDRLENGAKGRDYIEQLAGELYELWLKTRNS